MRIILILALFIISCSQKKKDCTDYRYRISVCNTGFGCHLLTDSIRWENCMIIAKDYKGRDRMIKPIEVKEGLFKDCK